MLRSLILGVVVLSQIMTSAPCADTPAPPAANPVNELRKASFEQLKTLLGKGPLNNVNIGPGMPTEVATFTALDEKAETLHGNFGGIELDLKWAKISNKQLAMILRGAGTKEDALEPGACVLSAALFALENQGELARAVLDKVILKDKSVQERYDEWVKKLGPALEAAKPAPPVSTPSTGGPGTAANGGPATNSGGPPPPMPTKWTPSGICGGGAMYSPAISAVDPKMMMINCDMSAAYLTYDGGHTWRMQHYSQINSSTACRPAFHPTDANIIYAAGGWQGLKISRNKGETWEPIGNLPHSMYGEIAIDPGNPNLMLAGAEHGAWRSLDAGKTWAKCAGVNGDVVAFHFDQTSDAARRVCFAATKDGIWRSDDGGGAWAEKCGGLPWRGIRGFSGGSNAKDKLIALYCTIPSKVEGSSLKGGIYRSMDKGETWESAMGPGLNLELKGFDQWSPQGPVEYHQVITTNVKPLTVYAHNSNTGIPPPHHTAKYKSEDGGKTWRPTFFPDPRYKDQNLVYDYEVAANGQFYQGTPFGAVLCGSDPNIMMDVDMGRCFITDDGGKDYRCGHAEASAPKGDKKTTFPCNGLVVTSTWNYYIDPFEPARHYICYTDIGFALSPDAGKTWRLWAAENRPPWQNTCYELAFDPEIPGKIWGAFSDVHDIPNNNIIGGGHGANGGGGVAVSTDFCNGWKVTNQGLPVAPCISVIVDPKSPKGNRTLYCALFGKGVYKSVDDGKSWTEKNKGLGAAANMRAIRVQLHADGTLFCLITAMRASGGGGAFLADGVGLYRSKDAGENWEKVNTSQNFLWPKDYTLDPKDSKIIYLGVSNADKKDEAGLYRTTDGGATWKRILQQGTEHFGAFLHPKKPGYIYATLAEGAWTAGVWLSKDNGATWTPFKELPFNVCQRVAFDPANENQIYVCTFGGSIWKGPAE